MRASDLVATTGGCAANAAVAVARLGGRARFAGPVGTDDASRRFLDALAKTGVDPSGVLLRRRRLDLGVGNLHRPRRREDGGDACTARASTARRRRTRHALVADIDVLLADNRFPDFVLPICRAAAARGIPVVLDVDKATKPGDPLFATASHLIFSSEALAATAGTRRSWRRPARASPPAFAASSPSPTARATCCGSSAARCGGCRCSRSRRSTRWAPATPFTAALPWRWPRAATRSSAMRFGAAAAALKCTRFGGISGTPGRAEVEALLGTATAA